MDKNKLLSRLALFSCFFALIVISLGAFTRLVDAGLGCPDWPGCYGHIFVPSKEQAPAIISYKAWAEMVHRYAVGCLSTLILVIVLSIFYFKTLRKKRNIIFALILILLLCYQILLGRWTVTLQLLPIIVSQHLLGGFLILLTLWCIFYYPSSQKTFLGMTPFIFSLLGTFLILFQIALGAWTSTNYASLSCADFPFCNNTQPDFVFHFKEAFTLFSPIGINYDGGVLPLVAKQTIQMVHRLGALIVALYSFGFAAWLLKNPEINVSIKKKCYVLLGILCIQLCLGMSNVLFQLPILSAVSHTIFAALLLLTMATITIQLFFERAR